MFKDKLSFMEGDGMAWRGDRPWFPIGAWGLPRCDDPMRVLADAGFNLVLGGQTGVPHDSRLKVILSAGRCEENMADFASEMRDKPECLGFVVDEPVWSHVPLDNIKAAYAAVRETAPELLFWQTHAPQNSVEEIAAYSKHCDVTGVNIYPVGHPEHSSIPDNTIKVVGKEVFKQREATEGTKPIWVVLQGFGWQNMKEKPPEPLLYPSEYEIISMMNDAIWHGARGIFFFGMHHEPKDSPLVKIILDVVRDLAPHIANIEVNCPDIRAKAVLT